MGVRLPALLAVAGCLAGCAPPRLTLPSGAGAPLDNFQAIYDEATSTCASVRTLTGELQLSGRVGGARLRGRALVGAAEPDSLRLEGLAPFGAPAFILAATGGQATVLLPRDNRVLRDTSPSDVLEALAGAALTPSDMLAMLSGCGLADRQPSGGREYGEWAAIDLDPGRRLFLKRVDDRWTILAASSIAWRIEYVTRAAGFPSMIHLVSPGDRAQVDLDVRVAQIETNMPLAAEAFAVNVPQEAAPLTLDELRASGPLRGATGEAKK